MRKKNILIGLLVIALAIEMGASVAIAETRVPVMFPKTPAVGGLVNVELTGGGIGQFPLGSSVRVVVGSTEAEVVDFNASSGSLYFRAPEIRGGYVSVEVNGQSYDLGMLDIIFNPDLRYFKLVEPTLVIPGTTEIVVSGGGFGNRTFSNAFYFGDVPISTFTKWSESEIKFIAPYGIKNGDSVRLRKFYLDAAGGLFGGTPHVVKPVISQVRANGADYAYAGEQVEVSGSGFDFASGTQRLRWGSYEIYPQQVSSTLAVFTAPDLIGSNPISLTISLTSGYTETITSPTNLLIYGSPSNDPLSKYQEYLTQIGVPVAWQTTLGSKNIVVAVIDDGISTNNPDLTNNIWTNADEIIGNEKDDDHNGYIDDIHGYDFLRKKGYLVPTGDHGTTIAGIIGAERNNGYKFTGISPLVTLMPLIVFPENGGASTDAVIAAIRYAADNGADIINLSLGGPFSAKYDEAIRYAYKKDVVIIAAAGNRDELNTYGFNLDLNPLSPVCNDGGENMVLGVASVDFKDQPSDYTSYGKCVDVVAPGEDILGMKEPFYSKGSSIGLQSGTSFAAPMATGMAVLLKAAYPTLTNREIIDVIIATTDPLQNVSGIYVGKLGSGRVNAAKALTNAYAATTKLRMTTFESQSSELSQRLRGFILLQVESLGEAWYVHPDTGIRHYMRDGAVAYEMMRNFGLGITNPDLSGIPAVASTEEMKNATSVCTTNELANRVKGHILLQVHSVGEAWYVDPQKCRRIYMKDGNAAYSIMRFLSLGITNADIGQIAKGQ